MMNSIIRLMSGLIFAILIAGCSGGGGKEDVLAPSDLCLVSVKDDNLRVCYGDKQSDVEVKLGIGETEMGGITYLDSVTLRYRNGVVALLSLNDGTNGVFETSRGAQIGMTKDRLKELYGEEHAIEVANQNLDYAYDSKADEFLEANDLLKLDSANSVVDTFQISMVFDDDGVARRIMLLDRKMATAFS